MRNTIWGLIKLFIKNLSITGLSSLLTQFFNMFFWLVFAKILSPVEFGSLSLVIGSALFFVILNELLISIVVQKLNKTLTNCQFDSIIVFCTIISIAFYSVFFLVAYFLDWGTVVLLCFGFATCLFGVLQSIYKADIEAKLNFKYLAKVELISSALSVLILVVFELSNFNPLFIASLYFFLIYIIKFVFYRTQVEPFSTSLTQVNIGWVISTIASFKELASFMFVNAYVRNADNYIVASSHGLGALGVYSFAYKVMLAPVTKVSGIIAKVLFPTLNKTPITVDKFDMLSNLFKLIFLLSITLMTLILFIESELASYFGFDNESTNYFSSVLFWLCFSGVYQSITSLLHVILVSAGYGNKLKRVSICYFALYSLAFVTAFFLELKVFCLIYFIATSIYFTYYMCTVYKVYGLSFFNQDVYFYFFSMAYFLLIGSQLIKFEYFLFSFSVFCSVSMFFYFLLEFKRTCKKYNF